MFVFVLSVLVTASLGRLTMSFYRPPPLCMLPFCLVNRGHYKPIEALSWPDARRLTLLHACVIFRLWVCGILIRGLSLHILALFWLARGDSVSIHVDRQAPHMGCRVFRWVWVIPWHVGACCLEPCWGMEIFEFSLEHACDRVVGN